MKSNSAGPDFVADVAPQFGERGLRLRDELGDDGRIGLERGRRGAGRRAAGASSGSDGMKPRSTTVCSASPISGSSLPIMVRRAARIAGDARRCATSTNSLPPASYIRGSAISWCTESPSGFMGSVIICW